MSVNRSMRGQPVGGSAHQRLDAATCLPGLHAERLVRLASGRHGESDPERSSTARIGRELGGLEGCIARIVTRAAGQILRRHEQDLVVAVACQDLGVEPRLLQCGRALLTDAGFGTP